APGIEQRIVFEHEHGGRDRVERAAARREDVAPGDQRCSQPGVVERAARLVHQTTAQSACAAMHGEREAGAGIAGRAGHYASADFLCRLSSRAMDPGATSLNGAVVPSVGWLLFFRFVQGIGAGLIISCAPAVVTSLYPETRRAHALGVFTLMFALGSAVGPLIGGALVARWGWPGVFWFRAPIA